MLSSLWALKSIPCLQSCFLPCQVKGWSVFIYLSFFTGISFVRIHTRLFPCSTWKVSGTELSIDPPIHPIFILSKSFGSISYIKEMLHNCVKWWVYSKLLLGMSKLPEDSHKTVLVALVLRVLILLLPFFFNLPLLHLCWFPSLPCEEECTVKAIANLISSNI